MDKAITGLVMLAGGAIAYTLWNREDAERQRHGDEYAGADTADITEVLQRIDDEARFGRRAGSAHGTVRDSAQ